MRRRPSGSCVLPPTRRWHTAAAIRALSAAATRDSEVGAAALEAGDRLVRLGAVRQAADAYLYAVTPARSTEEVERIARTQERAGIQNVRAGSASGRRARRITSPDSQKGGFTV